ncbi:MAG TPA: BolA/IbaG family iron-sulfur metabolism protein [Kofleriaceae bacterium]|jgi:acid stress-induced BolA-like protein IbaG/YrbA|nr:BolA/IbaG family iron-sulfur metabolism protein [Kofleriaceae bacterium]
MSSHHTSFTGSVPDAIRDAIRERIADAETEVSGGGGHYTIRVLSAAFAGKSLLEKQRLVLGAIAHLMKGDDAPVHAVDKIETVTR